jgi:hypothetical protein
MIHPLVTDLAVDGVPAAVTCRVLKFSKQGYYRWRASPVTERDWADAHLVKAARWRCPRWRTRCGHAARQGPWCTRIVRLSVPVFPGVLDSHSDGRDRMLVPGAPRGNDEIDELNVGELVGPPRTGGARKL